MKEKKYKNETDETIFMEFLSECCNGELCEKLNTLKNEWEETSPLISEMFPLIFEKEINQSEVMMLSILSNIQIECKNEIILGYRNGVQLPILLSLINFIRDSIGEEQLNDLKNIKL